MEGIGRLPFTNRREHTRLSATGAWVRTAAGDLLILLPFYADCERKFGVMEGFTHRDERRRHEMCVRMQTKKAETLRISGHTIADPRFRALLYSPGLPGDFYNLPAVFLQLRGLDIADGDLAGAAILLGIEGNLLTLVEAAHAGALEGRGVDEYVLAAVIRRNKAEALLIIVELYSARVHGIPFTGLGTVEPKPPK
jgi:hypothetical protein